MPQDQKEIQYTATITHNTGSLFGVMQSTVKIPVKRTP